MRMFFAAAMLAAAPVYAAFAQEGPPPGEAPMMMQRGMLFVSPMGEPFRTTSENPAPPIHAWFAAADTDNSGGLSRDEFVGQAARFFRTLDTNADGNATSSESTTLWREHAPEMLAGEMSAARGPGGGAMMRRGGGGGGPPGGSPGGGTPPGGGRGGGPRGGEGMEAREAGAVRFGLLNDAEPVMACDMDFSRRVTRDEFEVCASRRFDLLDANHDGVFALAESERAQRLLQTPTPDGRERRR